MSEPTVDSDASRSHRDKSDLSLLISLTAGWLTFGVVSGLLERPMVGGIQIVAGVGVGAVAFLARRERAGELRGHLAASITASGLVGVALVTGQQESISWWYLLVLPAFVGQLSGWRGVLTWTAVGVLLAVLVNLSELVVVIPPEHLFSDDERVIGGILMTTLALVYTLFVRRLAERQLSELEDRQRTIGEQAEALAAAQAELEQARDGAILASKGKTRLMARVSHELRTPLNGLLGLSEMLAESPLAAGPKHIATTLRASARGLRQLVEDLLDVTRIEEQGIELHPEACDVRQLVGEVLDTFAGVADKKALELVGIVASEVPQSLILDQVRMRQVVSNLVSNALKFTEKGSVTVRLSGKVAAGVFDGAIEVEDSGPGIEAELLPQLFVAYQQLDVALDKRREGAGLGLWIASELARSMGASIEVESVVGQGTTFRCPLRADVGSDGLRTSSGLLLVGIRVLAIEPDAHSRAALVETARFAGIDLFAVPDLPQALESLGETRAAIVLVSSSLGARAVLDAPPSLKRAAPDASLVLAAPPSNRFATEGAPRGYVTVTLKPYRLSRLHALVMDLVADPTIEGPVVTPPGRTLRCLVVDDDSTNRLVARLMLQRLRHTVTEADSAEAARAHLAREKFDVLFVDVHMPQEDGLAFARWVRREHDTEYRLWIVALTAATDEETRAATRTAGMDDFVEKPIETTVLAAALERAQRGARRRSRSASSQAHSLAALDDTVIGELFAMMGDEAPLILRDYLENVPVLMGALREGVERRQIKEAHRAAHTLASSSAVVGAISVASIAKRIEHGLDQGHFPDADLVQLLESRSEAANAKLQARADASDQ